MKKYFYVGFVIDHVEEKSIQEKETIKGIITTKLIQKFEQFELADLIFTLLLPQKIFKLFLIFSANFNHGNKVFWL